MRHSTDLRPDLIYADLKVNGEHIVDKLIEGGFVWYTDEKVNVLWDLQRKAKENAIGLWSNPDAISPAEWRKVAKQNQVN